MGDVIDLQPQSGDAETPAAIARKLRQVADEIERGEWPQPQYVVVLIECEQDEDHWRVGRWHIGKRVSRAHALGVVARAMHDIQIAP